VKPRSNIGSDHKFGLRVNTHLPTLTEINQSLGPARKLAATSRGMVCVSTIVV
jgi:hypothetical protein